MPARKKKNNGNGILTGLWSFVAWVAGILVSLAVGFGMIDGTLKIPFLNSIITSTAGWIVVILTVVGAILVVIDKMSK